MNIVLSMTRNVYPWCVPCVRSLARYNSKARLFICCEDDDFPIELPIEPEVINVSDQKWFAPDSVNYRNQFSYINLLKVVYPSLLPVQKVIHLDIDTIVCDSLDGLWRTDVTGKWFAAVPQFRGQYTLFGDKYYNMGVALINLTQMRKDNAESELVRYLNETPTPYADQDAWNQRTDKAVPVDARWNENWACGETDNPAVVHYCGISNWYNNDFLYRGEYLKRWNVDGFSE